MHTSLILQYDFKNRIFTLSLPFEWKANAKMQKNKKNESFVWRAENLFANTFDAPSTEEAFI